MEAVAFIFGLALVGGLALRFGHDSRDGLRSKEQELASYGFTWVDPEPGRVARPSAPPRPERPYPTLAFIEQALGTVGPLTADPDAALLEVRARYLAAEYLSDLVWTTGVVPEAAFRRVLAELAPALLDAPILAVERPIAGAERVDPAPSTAVPDQQAHARALARDREANLGLAGSVAPV